MAGPLEGIRIVEMGQMIAVPAATHLLAVQGATIVKVEGIDKGDDLRKYGSQKGGMSGWFANANGGKRSIGLDLQSDAGSDVMWKLIDDADVFIQGFRPGAVARLGFGPDVALERNPGLVYVSSSGFGGSGPYADRPVYDPVIQALSGWAGSQMTNGDPALISGMVADKVAALTTSQAITAALVSRGRTGKGQHVEMSMLESNIAFNWPDVMMHTTVLDEDALHIPNVLSAYQLFASSDGWVSVTAGNDAQWQAVCDALDRPELATDERFATAANRQANADDFKELLQAELLTRSADHWESVLDGLGVPASRVRALDELIDEGQPHARGLLFDVEVGGRQVQLPTMGVKMNGEVPGPSAPPPRLGQDNERILADLGYTPDDIAALRKADAI